MTPRKPSRKPQDQDLGDAAWEAACFIRTSDHSLRVPKSRRVAVRLTVFRKMWLRGRGSAGAVGAGSARRGDALAAMEASPI
jgi:hypothetical protein